MPQYSNHDYAQFLARAHAAGSGLGIPRRQDGSLQAIGALLRQNSSTVQIENAIAALPVAKLSKYRRALVYLEQTFPIPIGQRIARPGSAEAVRFLRNPVRPTAQFNSGNIVYHTINLAYSDAQEGLGITVPEFLQANAATTRLLLIHLGGPQADMNQLWKGQSALAHMNDALAAAVAHGVHVCILRDPHQGGRGVGLPTPGNAVCAGLRDQVGKLPANRVWVADGGARHSAFHDPAFQAWATAPAVDTVVVAGFDADVCVCGNVFGVQEADGTAHPPQVVPALINFVDVVTARPLLSGGDHAVIHNRDAWGSLAYSR